MRAGTAVVALALVLLVASCARAYTIKLEPSENVCFFENLNNGRKFGLAFEVGDGGNHDIGFQMKDPGGKVRFSVDRSSAETYTFVAEMTGRYEYCFINDFSTVSAKSVTFDILADDGAGVTTKPQSGDDAALDAEIVELLNSLRALKDDQQYARVRERSHRDTAESTNERVQWYSLFQVALLVAVTVFQLWYLRYRFESKVRI